MPGEAHGHGLVRPGRFFYCKSGRASLPSQRISIKSKSARPCGLHGAEGDAEGNRWPHVSPGLVSTTSSPLTDCSGCVLARAAYMSPSRRTDLSPLPPFVFFFHVRFHRSGLILSCSIPWFLCRQRAKLEGMKIQCDACEGAAATVVCCADEAALCARCDVEIHAANKLASKHQRLPLEALSARLPRCDVCQEKAAFIFCVEDRALFCQDCDEPIHVPGTLSGNHQRYLATGIRVGFGSASGCSGADSGGAHDADHHAPQKAAAEQAPSSQTTTNTTASAEAQQVPSPPQFLPQGWAVDELLQFSDYETGDKMQKESPLGFKELDWFADIDLFQDQAPKAGRMAAMVPEMFGSQAVNDAAYYRPGKATGNVRQSKKARIEVPDDEDDYLLVPDLG